ncbi:MAG: beta-lactamase family protein [Bacteroidetes bacterium]|nr:beta-lactamase family protein [Bacteroidota bacterium]
MATQTIRSTWIPWHLLASAILACSATAQAPQTAARIEQLMQQTPVAGLSVAVVKKGQIIYQQAFGYRDLEKKQPLRNDDLFRIASISKSFTATCLMQLVDQGRLSLNDDVGTLVGFPVRNPNHPSTVITLRMLLSHHSSINDSQGYFSLDAIDPSKNPEWEKSYNAYAPDSGYQYCNLNYNMAGAILERLTQTRFDVYVQQAILKPLGLYGGYCVDSLDANRLAPIYAYQTDSSRFIASPAAYAPRREELATYVMGRSTPLFSPTGGMKISAADLARYMTMHARKGRYPGGRILSRRSAHAMQTPLTAEEGYGLALLETSRLLHGQTMHGHTGSAYGLYSAMFWHPRKRFGFVVISNGCHPGYTDGFNTVIRKTVEVLYATLISKETR